jgi:hypothetical protein
MPDDERQRIRGYLQAQAAKLTVPQLMERVRADSERLAEAARAAAAVDQDRRPTEDDWSVNEVFNHVWESCARVNAGMIAAAFDGNRPEALADLIGSADRSLRAEEWVDLIRAERETTFARLAGLTGDEHLEVRWLHPFFGALNWREWLLFLRLHDLDHAGQVQGIVEALKR